MDAHTDDRPHPGGPGTPTPGTIGFDPNRLNSLGDLDLTQPPRGKPRTLNERTMAVIAAANAAADMLSAKWSPRKVTAAMVRVILNQLGLNTEDQGSQWLGDVLGRHGLCLPATGSPKKYEVPKGGVTRGMVEAAFTIPPDWDWSAWGDSEPKAAPAAEAEPMEDAEAEATDEIVDEAVDEAEDEIVDEVEEEDDEEVEDPQLSAILRRFDEDDAEEDEPEDEE